jgi:S-adenosylmethionine decarboxylase
MNNINSSENVFWNLVKRKQLNIIKKMEQSNDPYYNKINKIYMHYFNELSKILNDEDTNNIHQVIECGKNVVLKLINKNEYIDDGYFNKHFKITKNLYAGNSKYQSIQVYDTEFYGKILIIDDDIQFADFNASNPLFDDIFFTKLQNILTDKGILVFNGVNLSWSPDMAYNLLEQQQSFFKYSRIYQCYLPMYGDGYFCFVISSNYMDPLYRVPKYNNIETKYYNLEIHNASFQLPTYLKNMLYDENKIKPFYFGYHITIEMNGLSYDILNSENQLLDILKDTCVNIGKLKIKNEGFYKFNPQGITAYIILSTSHASIHTWPELGKCAIDIFTCKTDTDISDMITYLIKLMKPVNYFVNYIHRKI